jgi:hypothetical protein
MQALRSVLRRALLARPAQSVLQYFLGEPPLPSLGGTGPWHTMHDNASAGAGLRALALSLLYLMRHSVEQ